MTTQIEFMLKMFATLVVAGVAWTFMVRAQKRKQAEADAQFEWTMKAIELRNKKVDNNESEKAT